MENITILYETPKSRTRFIIRRTNDVVGHDKQLQTIINITIYTT